MLFLSLIYNRNKARISNRCKDKCSNKKRNWNKPNRPFARRYPYDHSECSCKDFAIGSLVVAHNRFSHSTCRKPSDISRCLDPFALQFPIVFCYRSSNFSYRKAPLANNAIPHFFRCNRLNEFAPQINSLLLKGV